MNNLKLRYSSFIIPTLKKKKEEREREEKLMSRKLTNNDVTDRLDFFSSSINDRRRSALKVIKQLSYYSFFETLLTAFFSFLFIFIL